MRTPLCSIITPALSRSVKFITLSLFRNGITTAGTTAAVTATIAPRLIKIFIVFESVIDFNEVLRDLNVLKNLRK